MFPFSILYTGAGPIGEVSYSSFSLSFLMLTISSLGWFPAPRISFKEKPLESNTVSSA